MIKVERDEWVSEKRVRIPLLYIEAKKYFQGKCVGACHEALQHQVMAREVVATVTGSRRLEFFSFYFHFYLFFCLISFLFLYTVHRHYFSYT